MPFHSSCWWLFAQLAPTDNKVAETARATRAPLQPRHKALILIGTKTPEDLVAFIY